MSASSALSELMVFLTGLLLYKKTLLKLGRIDHHQKLHVRTKPLKEQGRCLCYQEESASIAICTTGYSPSMDHFIRLYDVDNFLMTSSLQLKNEYGCSIVSCSFNDDDNAYYCVGTAYFEDGSDINLSEIRGCIHVLKVVERELLEVSKIERGGAVLSIEAHKGRLVAGIGEKVQVFKWTGQHLELECETNNLDIVMDLHCGGDKIIAGHPNKSMNILIYQPERRVIDVVAGDKAAKWMTAIGMLGERIYVGADNKLNLSTVCVNYEGEVCLKTIGQYHLGDYVNRFRHGSVATNFSNQIETVLFATASGGLGIIASLTCDEYLFFTRLEDNLRAVMGSVEGLSQKEWRSSFSNKLGNFVDGDFVELFLDAEQNVKTDISSRMRFVRK